MPTYEYRCSAGHQYEKREGFDAPAKQKCERCRRQASRVISAPPIVFKGNGFYKTDSRGSETSIDTGSSSNSSSGSDLTPSTPAASDHGHSHGPGGHTHGPSKPTAGSDTVENAAAS